MKKGGIVILDFGSQYNQLIARRVREMGVYAEVIPFHEDVDKILAKNQKVLFFLVDLLLFMLRGLQVWI